MKRFVRGFVAAGWVIAILLVLPARAGDAGWPDLTRPPSAQGGGGGDAALLVGIEDYWQLPDITGAEQNVRDWYRYLTTTLEVSPSRITLLPNDEATVEEIRRFAAKRTEQVRSGGTMWFVFVGHGAPSQDGSDGILIGADAKRSATSVYSRSLTRTELMDILGQGRQERTVVVLDACFSGQSTGGEDLVEDLQAYVPSAAVSPRADATVLSAGLANQFAGPLPGAGRPAFSYLVLGALRGWGDRDGNGAVTAQEAVDYAGEALDALVKDRSQTPELSGVGGRSVLSRGTERGPDLADLALATSGGGGSGSNDLLVELEQLRDEQQRLKKQEHRAREERQQKLSAERSRVEGEAAQVWSVTEELAQAGGTAGELALRKFLDKYGDGVSVTIDGEPERIQVAQAAQARQWLDGYDEEIRDDFLADHDYGMVRIEPSEFLMGSPGNEDARDDDEDQHRVRITASFLLGETEVTQALWKAVMGDSPAATRERFWSGETHGACSEYEGVGLVGSDLPVHCVDWFDVVRFCNRLSELEGLESAYRISGETVTWDRSADGYRLPTEAEWEYAARAGRQDLFAGADSYEDVCSVGNVSDLGAKQKFGWSDDSSKQCTDQHYGLATVGSYLSNAWGLYDMTGNVLEWVWDWYGEYPSGTATDPAGASTGSIRVLRGGSWYYNPRYARVADRSRHDPGGRNFSLGFRLARSIP
jgi:formylglycine-generating enzyme required for sulfatase activity